jgi:hypothetical protein
MNSAKLLSEKCFRSVIVLSESSGKGRKTIREDSARKDWHRSK